MKVPDTGELRENLLLAELPGDALDRLTPHLEPAILPPFEVLFNFDDSLSHVYFPNRNTVVSTLCRTDDEMNVEVGLSGNESIIGFSGLFGVTLSPYQNLVQVPGAGWKLPIKDAQQEFKRCGAFQNSVLKFVHSFLVLVSQTALCNRIHNDEERLARWLLLSKDRMENSRLQLPRDLLAKMLGKSRSGVAVSTAMLERAGIIAYNNSELTILDREKLESVCCSCYWVAKRQMDPR